MGILITKSDIGSVREQNEDYCWAGVNKKDILLVVCDGLGSYKGSKLASKIAVEQFKESFLKEEYRNQPLNEWFLQNISIIKNNFKLNIVKNKEYKNMSTTIVLSLIIKNVVHTFWIGDSRMYSIQKHDVNQITVDHNVINRLRKLKASSEIFDKFKNDLFAITHFIDASPEKQQYDYVRIKMKKKSGILLCSDGLHNYFELEKIYQLLSDKENIEKNSDLIIRKTIENKSDDNITFVWYYNGK